MSFSAELFLTTAVRGGVAPDPATGAVLTPVYQSTTYRQQAVGVHKGFTYSRAANPTVSALEAALGALEDTPPAVCFASGMAAIFGGRRSVVNHSSGPRTGGYPSNRISRISNLSVPCGTGIST